MRCQGNDGASAPEMDTQKRSVLIKRRNARQRNCRRAAQADGKQSFVKKIAQSNSNHGLPRRTAGLLPGVQPIFNVTCYFLENMVFGTIILSHIA